MENTFFEKHTLVSVTHQNMLAKPTQKPIEAYKGRQVIKSLTYAGIYLVLNNLALEYMSGEELLTYVKGYLHSIAVSMSPVLNVDKAAERTSPAEDVFPLNPGELVKRVHNLFNKKTIAKAA